jgi:hypothetical protein
MRRLNELGYSDGQNLHLVYRSADFEIGAGQ